MISKNINKSLEFAVFIEKKIEILPINPEISNVRNVRSPTIHVEEIV